MSCYPHPRVMLWASLTFRVFTHSSGSLHLGRSARGFYPSHLCDPWDNSQEKNEEQTLLGMRTRVSRI